MRKIKFRGKGMDTREWVKGSLVIYENKYYILLDITEHIKRQDFEVFMIEVDPETVGQYTGLKDKNGKEIYEGDIFNLGDNRILYIVEWFDTGLSGRQNGNSSRVGLQYWQTEIEVIGNIHDNPEMLEV